MAGDEQEDSHTQSSFKTPAARRQSKGTASKQTSAGSMSRLPRSFSWSRRARRDLKTGHHSPSGNQGTVKAELGAAATPAIAAAASPSSLPLRVRNSSEFDDRPALRAAVLRVQSMQRGRASRAHEENGLRLEWLRYHLDRGDYAQVWALARTAADIAEMEQMAPIESLCGDVAMGSAVPPRWQRPPVAVDVTVAA